jgi:pimeloyl-ACP methyl ester carboxylesterase
MTTIKSKTILFITGAFVNHACWDNWKTFFESKGYKTIAPPWPGKEGDPLTLRARHPDKALAAISLSDVLKKHIDIIKALPEKPILIGHSAGGLMSQLLMNKGLAAAAVAIHPAPPQNVVPYEFSFLKSTNKALGFFTPINESYMMSFEKWQYAFTNEMSFEDQKNAYYAIATPESKRFIRSGLTSLAAIDFKSPYVPLLILAGSKDHCIPTHLVKRVYERYKKNGSTIEFKEKDRNHFVLGLPTWKEDAEDILNWISTH